MESWRLSTYWRPLESPTIVHAHSPFATTLVCLDLGIRAFHFMVAVAGGSDVRCASYATFGTQALADGALRALDGRRACLLSHHGMITVARSLKGALALAVEVETLAEMYWRALQTGEPTTLSEGEMSAVLDRFAEYEGEGED